ncbi:sigma factor [Streptosporangium subroseum]|uniref:sigma factor n=1 Tax=Streptosporangium subroseum TaxID=106412 RepID=UPI003434F556
MDDDPRFADFVAERADALLRYGYVLSGNPHDAADLTQEALIRLHRAWSSPRTAAPSPADEVLGLPDPVEKVWPQAVRKIPATLPNGRAFGVQTFIDDHTLLIQTSSSFEKTDALYAYDMDSAEAHKITDVPTPGKTVLFASDFTVGAGQVVWWTARRIDKTEIADLWAAPLSGGEARLVASYQNGKDGKYGNGALDPPAVTGDGKVAFSFRSSDGVFTVPLGGGTVEPVAGAEKYHLLSWPWVGSGGMYNQSEAAKFAELLNVETGEKRTALVNPGEREVRCGLTVCTGQKDDGKGRGTVFYRLRDGSQEKKLPGSNPIFGLAADRFHSAAFTTEGKLRGVVLYDLATGKSGDLGIRPDRKNGMPFPRPGRGSGRLLDYELKGQIVIIDLSKIT